MPLPIILENAEKLDGEYLKRFFPATSFIRERQEYFFEPENDVDGLLVNGVPSKSLPVNRKLFRICIEHGLGLTELQPTKDGKPYGEPTFVEVLSYKFPKPEAHYNFYQTIVDDLFRQSASLPFSFKAVTQRGVTESPQPPTPLFTYYFIKGNLPAFQSAIETVLAEPHRLQCEHPDRVLLHEVSEVDGDVLLSILQSPDTWLPAEDFALSRVLQVNGKRYAPERVWQRLPEETFDTRENRFILHFLRQTLMIAERLPQQSWWKQVENLEEAKAIRELTSLLRETTAHPMFSEVGEMYHIPFNSQVLMRREGYRDLFVLWQQFHSSSQPLFDQWQQAMDVREMHWLYELWVYFKLINEIGKEHCIRIDLNLSDEEGVAYGSQAVFDGERMLFYNQSFHPRWHNFHSYSMVLRPDYFWVDPQRKRKVVLDAKFSMNVIENDNEIESEDVREGHPVREDLYKMHTYRDALVGTQAAVILYPGTVSVFMPIKGKRIKISLKDVLSGDYEGNAGQPEENCILLEGIGAIPLSPVKPAVQGE